ncbi:MAG: putative methylase [Tepidiphilus sp.]|nr:putative methylase [Tepidiphilus sp.]
MQNIKAPKKLIEVALPLDAINEAAAREKSIRHGHPSTLHLWWARRPLAAARAVIFAQMVNDPGYERALGRGVNKEKAQAERERLFRIIEDLVKWENTNNEEVLERAREEIRKSWRETCALNRNHPQAAELFDPDKLPAFHDPFAGGGALPLEAQRLGLESYASDLNPVAVTINKAMIEIPPRFAGQAPVGPLPPGEHQRRLHEDWRGARGLAEDVRRYGAWMRAEAEKRIGHLYPPVEITPQMAAGRPDLEPLVGQKLTVIAWLWARTVKSPNPAFSHVDVPLASTFVLSSKPGKEAYVLPVVEGDRYRFTVKVRGAQGFDEAEYGRAKNGTKLARGANFQCLVSDTPIGPKHIYAEANAGRMGARLMAIVAEGVRGRVYLTPTEAHEAVARQAQPEWRPEVAMPENPRWFSPPLYGLTKYGDLFTARQLVALTTFSDLVQEAIEKCRQDAMAAGMADDGIGLDAGGTGATAYAQAVGVYLAFAEDKCSDYWSSICTWHNSGEKMRNTFGRQAIPMTWDFAEANPLCESSGNWMAMVDWSWKALAHTPESQEGFALQADAQTQTLSKNKVISTDPPYYDNIGYADLSDFFYVWLRRALKPIFPNLYATLAVPKAEELVATPYRHGSKEAAERFFLDGMKKALKNLAEQAHPAFPVTIYYAFKQSETQDEAGTSSTGWETFLQAVLDAGFALTGTWPMRTELGNRMIGSGTNALASSIVLVCRKRVADAPVVSRREFLRELNATLPEALEAMTRGGAHSPVAPVDLSQAIIGPGMAIFSQYAAVLEADGTPMSVRTALALINRFLAEDDFDHDTQFCLHWFEQHGWASGKYGEADVLARAKGTSVDGLVAAGVVESARGELRLLKWHELPADWSPEHDTRVPAWEVLHQLIRALNQEGEAAAGRLLARMPERADPVRTLAYRLYTLCERKGWAEEARAYNELVTAWSSIEQAAGEAGVVGSQAQLDI